jgi:hypothetical protein
MKNFLIGVMVALLVSGSINFHFWQESANNEKEYISAFATLIDNTYKSSSNVLETKGETQRSHLSNLHKNLIQIDTLYKIHPNDMYYEYFKEYDRMVGEYLNNPSLQIDSEQISELNKDLGTLRKHYFVDFEIKDISLQQFDEHLLVITQN